MCAVGTAGGDEPPDGFINWTAEATLKRAEPEQVEIEISWHRSGRAAPLAGDVRTVFLRDGQSHLLDVVAAEPTNPTRCSHVSFLVTANLAPQPADALLAHRIWLVVERDGGRLTSGPVEVVGPPGRPVAFRVRPLTWPLGGLRGTAQGTPEVAMEVEGRLTAKLVETGDVEATLHVARRLQLGGWSGGSGTMTIRGPVGQAVTVGVPAPGGVAVLRSIGSGATTALPHGVTRTGDDLHISLTEYFAATRTALVFVTERIR
jgi:hypothetical protein